MNLPHGFERELAEGAFGIDADFADARRAGPLDLGPDEGLLHALEERRPVLLGRVLLPLLLLKSKLLQLILHLTFS